ncbi:MAG: DUF3568 family protein [Gemmatimonadales bacterium]
MIRIPVASLLVGLATSGCLLAAAGAGAGGAVYLSDRGAESVVAATVTDAFEATRQAFAELGIEQTKSTSVQETTGERREIEGRADDRDVKVTVRTQGESTKVEVTAQRSAVTWDQDFAKRLLERIVALSSK